MKKYFNFFYSLIYLITFIYLIANIRIYDNQIVYLGFSYMPLIILIFSGVTTILEHILNKSIILGLNILYIGILSMYFFGNVDKSMFSAIFSLFYLIYFIYLFSKNKTYKYMLPNGILTKFSYEIYKIVSSIIILLFFVTFLKVNIILKIVSFVIYVVINFLTLVIFIYLNNLKIDKIHKEFVSTRDYKKLKKDILDLNKDYLFPESKNQLNMILLNYAVDYETTEFCSELADKIFKPNKGYIDLYNQSLATYYLNKKDFIKASEFIEGLKNSNNINLRVIGKRFDIIKRLENNEYVNLLEIDEVADYSNTINSISTYQIYQRFYMDKDYSKYMEYANKINQLRGK